MDSPRPTFSDPRLADPDGLVAIGGEMSVPRLVEAYTSGIFPWTDDPLSWWSPDPRAIFDLSTIQTPKKIQKRIRQNEFVFTVDKAFRQVISACARMAPNRKETWISPRFIDSYDSLHKAGIAHSVEVWQKGELVGGVYGVAIGAFFAGESMFYLVPDASKAALYTLFSILKKCEFQLFDTQVINPFTESLGAIEIPRDDYLRRLKQAISVETELMKTITKWNANVTLVCGSDLKSPTK